MRELAYLCPYYVRVVIFVSTSCPLMGSVNVENELFLSSLCRDGRAESFI